MLAVGIYSLRESQIFIAMSVMIFSDVYCQSSRFLFLKLHGYHQQSAFLVHSRVIRYEHTKPKISRKA